MFLRVLVSTPKHEQTIKDQIFWESLTQKKVKKKKITPQKKMNYMKDNEKLFKTPLSTIQNTTKVCEQD